MESLKIDQVFGEGGNQEQGAANYNHSSDKNAGGMSATGLSADCAAGL